MKTILRLKADNAPIYVAENKIPGRWAIGSHLHNVLAETVRLVYADPRPVQGALESGLWTAMCTSIVRGD